jgi:predicted porin
MTTASIFYDAAGTITLTSSGLASTAGLLVGRQSTVVDNTSSLYIDFLVGGKLVTTATTTTNTQIQIWAFASYDGTTFSAGAGASDAGFTPDAGAKNLMRLLIIIPNITTTAVTYAFGPFSIAQAYGGVLPIKWGIYIVHNTGTALAAGGETKYTPVKYTSA